MNSWVKIFVVSLFVIAALITVKISSSIRYIDFVSSNSTECSSFNSRLEGPLMRDDPLLVSYLQSEFLRPPSDQPYNLYQTPIIRKNSGSFFENYLYENFQDIYENGFFVEAGALDGETGSNTIWLEYHKKWTGLLIEAFESSCKVLSRKHRKAWYSCSCLSPKKYAEKPVFEIPSYKTNYNHKYWLYKANVRSINSRFHTYNDIIQKTASFTYTTIQCFPLVTYLLALNVTKVDLLSLDTQGGEKTTLLSFPFDKFKVNYMFIEYFKRGPNPTRRDEELISFLDSQNFDLVTFSDKSGEFVFKNRNF